MDMHQTWDTCSRTTLSLDGNAHKCIFLPLTEEGNPCMQHQHAQRLNYFVHKMSRIYFVICETSLTLKLLLIKHSISAFLALKKCFFPSTASVPIFIETRSTTILAYLVHLKHKSHESKVYFAIYTKMFYELLYRAGNFQIKSHWVFKSYQCANRPYKEACVPVYWDSLLTTGRIVCLERHSNHSCSKKGGETFVVVSRWNTKIPTVSLLFGICCLERETQSPVTVQERITNKCYSRCQENISRVGLKKNKIKCFPKILMRFITGIMWGHN